MIFRSFDHVVSPENIYLNFVDSNEGTSFKFTYENSNNTRMFQNLCKFVVKTFLIIEGGCIVFVPSYSLLNKIKEQLRVLYADHHQLSDCVFFDEKDAKNTSSVESSLSKDGAEKNSKSPKSSGNVFDKFRTFLHSPK